MKDVWVVLEDGTIIKLVEQAIQTVNWVAIFLNFEDALKYQRNRSES